MSAAVDLTEEKNGGVIKLIEREGTGDSFPIEGDTVSVHYVGTLAENGDKFDSSRDRGERFSFTLGRGEVIRGWDLGVASMRKNELATLRCSSDYAYGDSGSPPKIPPKATLNFQVELLDWCGEDVSPNSDGSITKSVIKAGEKHGITPVEYTPVTVDVIGMHDGRTFIEGEFKFILGEGTEFNLPEGIDVALKKFRKGERSLIKMKGSQFGYGSSPPDNFKLPPNAQLSFDVTLKEFENIKQSWELDSEEKLSTAELAKSRGTEFFQHSNYHLAHLHYKRVTDLLEYAKSLNEDQQTKRDQLLMAAHLNLALVKLKLNQTHQCIEECQKALKLQPDNVKALYRKAQAYEAQSDLEEAIITFRHVCELNPGNKTAIQAIAQCQRKLLRFKKAEKNKFKGMFDKFSSYDNQKLDAANEAARISAVSDSSVEMETGQKPET